MSELERVRQHPPTRASSPTDPEEWTITEDGFRFGVGDRVYNYYDGVWVVVQEDPAHTHDGWFRARSEDAPEDRLGTHVLNSVRVSARPPERRGAG